MGRSVPRGYAYGGLVFLVWGILYTWAFATMEGRVKALKAEVDAFDVLMSDTSRRHDVLLTYVITLREQLARNGFAVPEMPPMEKEDAEILRNQENPL